MQHQALLENYLKQLHLSSFIQNYQAYAADAARTDLPYERFLLALCTAEVAQRDALRVERAIAHAKFPVLKELATFDFTAVQNISKATRSGAGSRWLHRAERADHFDSAIAGVLGQDTYCHRIALSQPASKGNACGSLARITW